jgi:glucose/arabinose dehydrogenase
VPGIPLLVVAVAVCVAGAPATSADEPPAVVLEPVVSGLTAPLDIAVRPAFPDDTVVAEQAGRLRVVRDGQLLESPLLDITDIVAAGGERGLLGVAPHPDPADDRVFVYYTDLDGRQLVSSFRAEGGDPDHLRRDSEVVVLSMEDPFPNHNGGGLAFGPDGYLYVSTGDGGGGGDPLGSGRDLGTLLGKILRLDVDVEADTRSPYGIPPDNPYVDQAGARPEIWHTGLRNPFRIRFDAASGDLWVGDVGQNAWEEVDLAPGGVGGLDFGWNLVEGTHCFATDPCDDEGLTAPVVEYSHDEGCVVTGGAVYRGQAHPELVGWYVFADYCSGRVWAIDAGAAGVAVAEGRLLDPAVVLDSGRGISAIAPGPAGELYATDIHDGELLLINVAAG